MFTALTVSVALAIMLASLLPFTVALEKGWRLAIYMFGAASLLAALFVVAAGVQMLGTYDVALNEPLDTEDAKRVAERGPRAGIAVALVLFWPLVLIGLGGWVAYQSGASLIQEIRITRRGTK